MGNSIGENKLVTIDELEELLCNLRNESENKENNSEKWSKWKKNSFFEDKIRKSELEYFTKRK